MKKLLKRVGWFFLGFWICRFLIYGAVGISTLFTPQLERYLFGNISEYGNSYQRMEDFERWAASPSDQRRGVLLGSSTAYRNMNAEVLSQGTDINWFNLGSSSQTPEVSLALLKKAVDKVRLDYVLLDVYVEILDYEAEESVADLLYNSTLSFRDKWDLFLLAPTVKSFDRLLYRTIKAKVPAREIVIACLDNGEYLGKGSTYSPKPIQPVDLSGMEGGIQRVYLSPSLEAIHEFCKEKGLVLMVNIAPVLGKQTLVPPLPFPVILNDAFNHQQDLFYDSHHMHGEGAILYSRALSEKIKALGI